MSVSNGSLRPFLGLGSATLDVPGVLGARPGLQSLVSADGMPNPPYSGTFPSLAVSPYVYGSRPDSGDGDQNDQGQRGQFHVINSSDAGQVAWGDRDSRYLGQAELCFMTSIPPDYEEQVVALSSTSLCPQIQGLSLPMVNRILRNNHKAGLNMLDRLTPGIMDKLDEAVIADEMLILSNKTSAFGRRPPHNLLDDDIITLRYAFGAGIMKTFIYLGAIQAQPNKLYEQGATQTASITAENGQTMISTQFKQVGYIRAYWGHAGMINSRSLYLILRPYDPSSIDGTGKTRRGDNMVIPSARDFPFQFVPYCPPDLSQEVPPEERIYTMANGEQGKAKVIFVGKCCEAESYRGVDRKTQTHAAGLVYANTDPNATASFNSASSLPLQRFRADPMGFNTGLNFTN